MDEERSAWRGRAVLHVDMDAFFAAVEQLDHPEWRGKPLVVGGSPDARGVIAAASYEARRYGVHSAMPAARAVKLLPADAVWARGRFDRYREMSRAVFGIMQSVTPAIQAASIDEAYLDVTPGETGEDPVELARRIQREVDALGLSCSVGVATSKTVAKIASDHHKPHGITVVRPGEEASFLAPLPVRAMPGIGAKTAERLEGLGIRTLGELANVDDATALHVLGSYGPSLVRRARGEDASPVHGREPVKSLSRERTYASDVCTASEVDDALAQLAEEVGLRLRRKGLAGRTVTVKLRYGADFTTRTVQRTLPRRTDLESDFLPVARELLHSVWSEGAGLRLLGIGLSGFEAEPAQLDLFTADTGEDDPRRRALAKGLDAVRERFGAGAVEKGMKPRTGRRREPS